MLEVRGLVVALGGRDVLRGIDLSVAAGEVVTLEGPSGAGKTTLLRAIAGLVPAAAGQIRCGAPAGLVFQQHALAARLSARDNVLVGGLGRIGFCRAALRAWPRPMLAEADGCLARVGLEGLWARRADRLSGGQRQRVAVARVLMQRARLLLADEPVASLDPENAAAVLDLLRGLARREGRAVLVTLHQPELARRIADRRLRMEEGRLWPL